MSKSDNNSNTPNQNCKVYKLFFILPICKTHTNENNELIISICKLPIYKIQKNNDNFNTKHYLCGIPVFAVKQSPTSPKIRYYLFGIHFMTIKKEYI